MTLYLRYSVVRLDTNRDDITFISCSIHKCRTFDLFLPGVQFLLHCCNIFRMRTFLKYKHIQSSILPASDTDKVLFEQFLYLQFRAYLDAVKWRYNVNCLQERMLRQSEINMDVNRSEWNVEINWHYGWSDELYSDWVFLEKSKFQSDDVLKWRMHSYFSVQTSDHATELFPTYLNPLWPVTCNIISPHPVDPDRYYMQ